MSYEPITKFPNFIYIPKIVPLVYDDVLSYYEFLNKVLQKLNETIDDVNALGVDVEELRENVERLASLVDGFDGRIETLETSVSGINSAIDTINGTLTNYGTQLETLAQTDTNLANRITTLENKVNTDIAAAVATLEGQISGVVSDVTAMQSEVTSNTNRIAILEEATINVPTMSNENKIICQDFIDLSNLDYEIVEVTNNSASGDNIVVNDGLIRFMSSASLNEMALVIHDVLPYYAGNPYTNQIVSFANRYKTSGSSNGVDFCINVPFNSLTGSTPYIASTGYTQTRASLRIVQLKRSTRNNNYYDLWIYNRYHGDYPILTGANVDYLNLVMVFRSLDTTSMSTDAIKAYFISELSSNGKQIANLIDKNIESNNVRIYQSINGLTNLVLNMPESVEITALKDNTPYKNVSDLDDEPWFAINDLSEDGVETFDKSFCTNVTKVWGRYSNNSDIGISSATIFFNGEIEILESTAVNMGGSWHDLGIINLKDGSDNYLIPEEEIEILAMPRLNINFLPCRCEMILTKARHLRLRVEFDDTNFNWNSDPLVIKYAGIAVVHWVDGFYPPA